MNREEYLKRIILETGKSQKAIANEAQIPYSTLRDMLTNVGSARIDNVIKLCKVLNISVSELDTEIDFYKNQADLKLSPHEAELVKAWRFQVLTGLRPGELLGLQRSDVFRSTVHVQRSVNIYGDITGGKNDNAKRTFELSPLAMDILTAQLDYLKSEGIESKWLFCAPDGSPIKEDYYFRHLKRFCEVNNMTVVSPYELRHTFVSIAKSLDTGTLKSLVGHSAAMDTLGVYGHTVDGELRKAAEEVNTLFDDILNDDTAKAAF